MTTGIEIAELQGLSDPQIIEEIDVEAIILLMRDDLVSRFPAISGVIDLETEPARKLIEVFAWRELNLRARVNDAVRATLLAYATGTDLEHLAAFYDLTRMAEEEDDRFRERIVLAIRGRSTGGTEPRYRALALEADIRVANAIAYTLGGDPTINVAIFSTENGGVADQALLDIVTLALNDPNVRMINDVINVVSAVSITQNVELNVWFLPTAPAALRTELPLLIKADWDNENDLGFDMTHSWLIARAMVPGVQRVEVVEPAASVVVPPFNSIAMGTVVVNDMGTDF